MEINVHFTTQLKAALGRGSQSISLADGATVQDAMDTLKEQFPEEFRQLLFSNGQVLPSILLSINDQQVDLDSPLSEGDTLTLLSAISGG